jgi:hypothetical protein
MADNLQDQVLDFGLNVLDTEADVIHITTAEATTYTEALTTYGKGNKDFGAGGAVGSPAAGTPDGRKVTTTAVTDGSVTGDGTVTNWAIVDSGNTRLLAVGTLSSPQAVTNLNTFTLGAFEIRIPGE